MLAEIYKTETLIHEIHLVSNSVTGLGAKFHYTNRIKHSPRRGSLHGPMDWNKTGNTEEK